MSSSLTKPSRVVRLVAWMLLEVLICMENTHMETELVTCVGAPFHFGSRCRIKPWTFSWGTHVEDSSFPQGSMGSSLTDARKSVQRYAASSTEEKASIQFIATDGCEENSSRLTGLLRRLSVSVFKNLRSKCCGKAQQCWMQA